MATKHVQEVGVAVFREKKAALHAGRLIIK